MNDWNDFFMAVASSAAALTGLIFVGVSISLQRILANPQLPSRASQSLILLLTVLVVSSLCLIPDQPTILIAFEVLLTGLVVLVATLKSDLKVLPKVEPEYKKYIYQNILMTQLAVMPYVISGIVIFCRGINGIYWLVPGIIFCFVKAVLDAWVLLVEIYR